MATGGVLGNGTKVAYSAASPVSWTKVAQLLDVPTFINLVPDDIDVTVHGATGNVKQSMPGLVSPPEITIDVLMDLDETTSPTHAALINYQAAATTLWWRTEVPVDRAMTKFKAWEFQGYVKSVNFAVTKINDAQKGTFTIRYAGGLSRYNAATSAIA